MTYSHCERVVAQTDVNTRHRFTNGFDDHAGGGFFQREEIELARIV